MTVAVKMTKNIGRHYGKRLYKAGTIYHVDQAEAEYLLAYKDLDGVNRFKRMIPKQKKVTKTPTSEVETPKKKRGRKPKKEQKQSPKIEFVVDEEPVTTSEVVSEDVKYEDEVKEEVLESEEFNPSDENQEYSHEV